MGIKIITDSVSDIPKDIIEDLNITILPLTVNFGDKSYKDGVEITSEEFFEKLTNANKLPTTSQVAPGEFVKEFKKAIENDDKVIAILMSSELSGTYTSALTAKKLVNTGNIEIVDSKAVTLAQGLIVIELMLMNI